MEEQQKAPQDSESLINGIRLLDWKSTEVTSCPDVLTHLKNEEVGPLPFLSLRSLLAVRL